jgi:hypothetical protein
MIALQSLSSGGQLYGDWNRLQPQNIRRGNDTQLALQSRTAIQLS